MDAPHLPEGLEKKAGPLPVWAWGVAVGLVVVGIMWYRRNSSGVAPVDTTGTDPSTIDNAGLYSGNNANAANATHATQSMAKQVRTNPAWLRQAVQYETGKGRNALVVLRALMRYLNAQPLNESQNRIVSDVLENVGLPPKVPDHVSVIKHDRSHTGSGGTVETPPTKPRRPRTDRGESVVSQSGSDVQVTPRVGMVSGMGHGMVDAVAGDSPATIAQRVYGVSSPFHIESVRRANGIGTTDEFVPGQKVMVPHV